MEKEKKSVVLVGCGNIGFRHLQALSALSVPSTIAIIEPNDATHSRIRDLIGQEEAKGLHRFALLQSLGDSALPPTCDLAVIATDTRHRRAAWEELSAVTKVSAVIFEKVLFPTIGDIDAVSDQLAAAGIEGFVNCGRRGFADYQSFARRFADQPIPVDVTVEGARFGLASNAVHFLDLAEMINGSPLVSLSAEGLQPGSVSSKRVDYVEIFGTLQASLANGAQVAITCHDREPVAVRVDLKAREADGTTSRIVVDEVAATVSEDGTEDRPFAIRYVSGMPDLYDTILKGQGSALTPYTASARQHRLFITALRSHLGLSNAADEPCPIS